MTDTPRCNALESNPLDSFDYRAWVKLARELERELIWASGEKAKLTEIVAARPEGKTIDALIQWLDVRGLASQPCTYDARPGSTFRKLIEEFAAHSSPLAARGLPASGLPTCVSTFCQTHETCLATGRCINATPVVSRV